MSEIDRLGPALKWAVELSEWRAAGCPMGDHLSRLLSCEEAAEMLGLYSDGGPQDPKRAILRMVQRGKLEGRRVGRRMRIVPASVFRILDPNHGR